MAFWGCGCGGVLATFSYFKTYISVPCTIFHWLAFGLVSGCSSSYLESLGFSRLFTTLAVTLITFLGLPILMGVFIFRLWYELKGFMRFAPWLTDKLSEVLESMTWMTPQLGNTNIAGFIEVLVRWALAIPDFLVVWVLAAFSAYFFCKDKRFFLSVIMKQLPQSWKKRFFFLYRDTSQALWHLFRVQLILMTLTSAFSMLFFSLLSLPYAITLGIIVGFVDLIPIVGPGLIYGGLALIQIYLKNPQTALALGLAYLIILLLRQFGEPHLVSERLNLHPLVAVMALYVGFRFWGLLGALIAPVLLVFLKAFMATYTAI